LKQGHEVFVASRAPSEFVIHVKFEDRDDGGLRARCDKIPEFYLSHNNPAKVQADVVPALEAILSAMYDRHMKVTRLPEVDEAMDRQMNLPRAIMQESYLGATGL
jgi:hypothetical protein